MQALSSFARKYAIMEELDGGFGIGTTPEAFVRLDSWEGNIQASIHVKGLKQGPYAYKLYLIFSKNNELVPLMAGPMTTSFNGMQNVLEIDANTLHSKGLKPDSVRFAAIIAENQSNKWVPLFSSFEKNYKWDESIRQVLLKKQAEKEKPQEKSIAESISVETVSVKAAEPQPVLAEAEKRTPQTVEVSPNLENKEEVEASSFKPVPETPRQKPASQQNNRCDIDKLESFLKNNFEVCTPFTPAARGYSWFRVSDLAKLSNIMYMSGINVPVFANPKILVGLFKHKHILAGIYRGYNGSNYYVIGVPAKDEKDNKPFENACRWVGVTTDSTVRDLGGYWLVYVSVKTGEIVF